MGIQLVYSQTQLSNDLYYSHGSPKLQYMNMQYVKSINELLTLSSIMHHNVTADQTKLRTSIGTRS